MCNVPRMFESPCTILMHRCMCRKIFPSPKQDPLRTIHPFLQHFLPNCNQYKGIAFNHMNRPVYPTQISRISVIPTLNNSSFSNISACGARPLLFLLSSFSFTLKPANESKSRPRSPHSRHFPHPAVSTLSRSCQNCKTVLPGPVRGSDASKALANATEQKACRRWDWHTR